MSKIDNITISEYRHKFGVKLAATELHKFTNSNTIVIGSPNSGISSGQGYALAAGLPYRQYINKIQGIDRTFIIDDRVNNLDVVIVDDTIVRGNTFKSLVSNLRSHGVKNVHVRIASPEIVNTCSKGIDIPTKTELFTHIAPTIEDKKTFLNVDSIRYLSLEDAIEVTGKNVCSKICGCFNDKNLDW